MSLGSNYNKMTVKLEKDTAMIFDLDGTLLDSKHKLISDVKGVFDNLGYNITGEKIEESRNWYTLALKYGIKKRAFDREFNKRISWEQALKEGKAPLFQDAIPCLENLKEKRFLLGLLTKSLPKYTFQKTDFHNLTQYFKEYIEVIPVTSNSKREGASSLIKKMNPSEIDSVYFVGDRVEDVIIDKDIEKRYQIPSKGIWINRNNKETPKELSNYQKINSLSELKSII